MEHSTTSGSLLSELLDNAAAPATAETSPAVEDAIEATEARTLAEREHQARLRATARGGVLARIVDQGKRDSEPAIRRIMQEVPQDMLAPGRGLDWDVSASSGRVSVTIGGQSYAIHPHAFGQIAGRYDIPKRYLQRLTKTGDWARTLASVTLNAHANNDNGRMLVRTYGGKIRAFLSDRYRRIDSRPLLIAFLEAIEESGMVLVDARATDVKLSVRAVFPELIDICGDPNLWGIEWTNSDYGAGKHEIRLFLLRTSCLNGMTGEAVESKVHLGARVSNDVQLSQKTLQLDTQTLVSAMGDVVRDACSEPRRKATVERVRKAAGERIELGEHLPSALRRALSKEEQDRMRQLFESPEAVMLPPAPTTFRLSQALSWMANTAASTDRALDLQALAGKVSGF